MKKLVLMLLCLSTIVKAMDNQYVYTQATEADIPATLALINHIATCKDDIKKLVILPKKFREMALQKNIASGRLFIARDTKTNEIIGMQKTYPIIDTQERNDICENEIRCTGSHALCTHSGYFNINTHQYYPLPIDGSHKQDNKNMYIYRGSDYTHPAHRGKNINNNLANYALEHIKKSVCSLVKKNNIHALHLLYGITAENAGNYPGNTSDRSTSIVKSFIPFVREVQKECYQNTIPASIINYDRYKAFKPTFDAESDECKPLDDSYSVEGFGCMLSYALHPSKDVHE